LPILLAPNVTMFAYGRPLLYVHPDDPIDPQLCGLALSALQFYYDFNRNYPGGRAPMSGPKGKYSDWYRTGVDDLKAASLVLLHYKLALLPPDSLPDSVAELRSMARTVNARISEALEVHDRYYVGSRITEREELTRFQSEREIFNLEVSFGCLWQETPEDCVKFYRQLMSSPVFCCIHDQFWFRHGDYGLIPPRLIAWTIPDQQRLPKIQYHFMKELATST